MKLGTIEDLRRELGTKTDPDTGREVPVCGRSFASSIKQRAGYRGKLFDIEGAARWFKKNGNHRITDAWPRKARNRTQEVKE